MIEVIHLRVTRSSDPPVGAATTDVSDVGNTNVENDVTGASPRVESFDFRSTVSPNVSRKNCT